MRLIASWYIGEIGTSREYISGRLRETGELDTELAGQSFSPFCLFGFAVILQGGLHRQSAWPALTPCLASPEDLERVVPRPS
ncbi:hypothetical protein RRG08_044131 [Elysia crispata]|uniref:Uncharacterized protein n=1 Tax=Elysia crispata TaxID=231223 RepID=A0AAE1DBU7_9GAST|nr:hypothetical protein RRG08_044131 [Elysia crispata]